MSDALKKSLMTAIKYIGWTAAGAAIAAAINQLPSIQLPDWIAVLIGGGLKTLATYISTRIKEMA